MTNGGTQRRSGGVRAFMIADLRGYTAFMEEQGDEASAILTERFADLARTVVESREGTVVETRGDEVLVEFGSPRSSVRAALDLHLAIAGGDDLPLQAGIGLDVGEAVPVGDGFRGRAINMAARLCARAKPGETLVTPELAHLAGSIEGIVLEDGGPVRLKGFSRPVHFLVAMPVVGGPAAVRSAGGQLGCSILGPLEVTVEGRAISVGSRKQRLVLAHLIVRANRVVSMDELIDAVWDEDPPKAARNTIQSYVSHLRGAIGTDRIESRAPGYLLHVETDEVDVLRFERALERARRWVEVDPPQAISGIDEALHLWRGSPFSDLADTPSLVGEATRLEELRLSAIEDLFDARLSVGERDVVGELQPLVERNPLRERLWGQVMLGLYRAGRQGDALAAFDRARSTLADELGIDPSPELRALHARILQQDPQLELTGRPLRSYRLIEQIGSGGYGVVWRAIDPTVGRDVAIKQIKPEAASDPSFVRRFQQEVQVVARLEHPHIVPLYDVWRDGSGAFLVMRLLRGGSVADAIANGSLPKERAIAITSEVASALSAVHRHGLVHRDVKAENVLLDEDGNAYLADLGIAVDADRADIPTVSATDGSRSPEQIRGEPATALSDIFGLGRLLSDMVGTDPPGDVARVIERATAAEPTDRYPDVQSLVVDLERATSVAPTRRGTRTPTPERNPYKGLRPFSEADVDDFFGRDALVERLIGRMREPAPASRFLALVGPSGSGKSSVVRAGLLPRLRAGAVPASDRWFFADMLPGARPMDELEGALLRAGVDPTVPLLDGLERDRGGLTSAIERVLPPDDSQLLLLVDQFEEVFTLVDDDESRGRFLETLLAAATDPSSRLRLVLTLRADFFDRPLAYPGFAELMRTRSETVVPLTAEELERAISGPAEQVGVVPELALVAEAVGDVTDQPGALPLLQYALTETFDARSDGVLTLEAYRATGGVTGALAKRAEQIYTAMHDEGREAARQLFLRLVSIGEGSEDTRRLVSRAEIASLEIDQRTMDAVIGAFGKHRLLSFDRDPDTRGPTVEVAHEALLRAWMRLRGWIDAARDDVIVHRRLTAEVEGWERAGRDASFLLRGSRLAQIEGWAATTGLALATDEREFVIQSVRARDDEEAVEASRREHERALERRSVVRMRGLVAVLTAAALIASVLTVVAIGQRQSSRDQARLATIRELSAAAQANVPIDPERSLLLALRAVETSSDDAPPPEAVQALHDALAAHRSEMILRDPSTANVAWSPNGRLIATGGSAGGKEQDEALIWDAFTGALLYRLSGHTADIAYVAFSPDSTRLVTVAGEEDARAIVWDTREGTKLMEIPGEGGRNPTARFSPDDDSVVVQVQPTHGAAWGSNGSLVHVVDANTGRERWRIVVGTSAAYAAAPLFGPDGSIIAIAADDGVHIVDATTHRDRTVIGSQPTEIVFSPDGSELATADGDHVGIWDLTTGQPHLTDPTLRVNAQKEIIGGLDWSADGRYLATGGGDGTARIFDAATGQQRLVLAGHSGGVALLSFNPDGTRLLTGGTDGTARIWNIEPTGTAEAFGASEPDYLASATFTPDGSRILTTGGFARDWFWDATTGQRLDGYDGIWADVAFSPDGTSLASIGDRTAIVDAATGKLIQELDPKLPPDGWTDHLDYHPDGSLVAFGTSPGYATLVDVNTGKPVTRLGSPAAQLDDMRDVSFSPDGTLLAGISGLATTYLWDVATRDELLRFQGQSGLATSVAFRPDGRSFATAGLDGATLWSTSGERLQTFTGVGHVDAIAFNRDGSLLATGGDDGLTHVWDVSTGRETLVLRGPSDFVTDVSFSPDAQQIVIAGADGTLWVDVLSVDRLVQIARSRLTRGFTDAECARYLHGESCSPAQAASPGPTPSPPPVVSGPEGAFRIDVAPGDLPAPLFSRDDRFFNSGAFTFSFAGGSWSMRQQGLEPWLRDDWGGTYTSAGDRIRFTVERGDPACRGEVWTARWSLETASTLSFSAISAIEAATDPACGPPERATATVRAWLGSHPMTRVA